MPVSSTLASSSAPSSCRRRSASSGWPGARPPCAPVRARAGRPRRPAARSPTAASRRRVGRGPGGSPRPPVRAAGRGEPAARGGTIGPDRRVAAAASACSAHSRLGDRSSSTAARTSGWATSTTRRPPRMCISTSPWSMASDSGPARSSRPVIRSRPSSSSAPATATDATSRSASGEQLARRPSTSEAYERGAGSGPNPLDEDGRVELVGERHRRQRAAAGVAVQPLGGARAQHDAVADPDELGDRGRAERSQPHSVAATVAHEPVERVEVPGPASLHDDEDGPAIAQPAVHERERLHGRQVGPLGVVDDDEQRAIEGVLLGQPEDQLADVERIGAGAPAGEGRRRREAGGGGLAQELVDDPEVEVAFDLLAAGPQHDRLRRHRVRRRRAPAPTCPPRRRLRRRGAAGSRPAPGSPSRPPRAAPPSVPTSGSCARLARHPHGPTPLVNVILPRTVPPARRGSFGEGGVRRLGDRADDG